MNNIYLVCGYRRTGKDTLFKILDNKSKNLLNSDTLFQSQKPWQIYKNPNHQNISFNNEKYQRIAFADTLKEEASEVYGIPKYIDDEDKDIKQFVHYKTKELVSARDIYIEWGAYRKSQNINYWCQLALSSVPLNIQNFNIKSTNRGTYDVNYVITDFRFEHEADYSKSNYDNVITIRVYRSDVPIPDKNIDSEHNLDKYSTEFLLVTDDNEFKKALELFPQYTNYIKCETI